MPRFLRPVETALAVSACLATAMVVLLVTIEVVARYIFASSLIFSNELARLMFVWAIFLGFPLALSRGRHVGIELLDAILPPRVATLTLRIGAVLGIVLLGITCGKSVESMLFNWDQRFNTLPLSAGLFNLPVVIGMAVSVVYLIVIAVTGRRVLIDDREGAGG